MTVRYQDAERAMSLSVGDVVAAGARGGHLSRHTATRSTSRMRLGQQVHVDHAMARSEQDASYRAEVRLERQLVVAGWTVTLHGRVDGLTEEDGHQVVEEVKSTVLDASSLYGTGREDWPEYVRQLEAYLWLASDGGRRPPVGRLVLVSVLDGSRHVLGIPLQAERVDEELRRVLERLVVERQERLAWLASRRQSDVPLPYETWRPGQERIALDTLRALRTGKRLLVQAPTGLGKTGPILWAALTFAREHDKQVFWATARTTHQTVAQDAVQRLRTRGLAVRALTVSARGKVCLNDVIACSPERCAYARDYHEQVREGGVLAQARELDEPVPSAMMQLGQSRGVCPFELSLDASEEVDLVIGDINYAFEPGVRLSRHFDGSQAGDWVVVVDEAHQLVERARGWGSPRVRIEDAQAAAERLSLLDSDAAEPFLDVVADVAEAIASSAFMVEEPCRDGVGVADLPVSTWTGLADRVDALALDYLRIESERLSRGEEPAPHPDPWLELARSVLRFADGLAAGHDETVALVGFGRELFVGLSCLDPSSQLGPRIAALGGWVGCSATLSPADYYVSVLGLPEGTGQLDVGDAFPAENRSVVVASRVSTTWKDRKEHANATAKVLSECIAATPGNVALYFPSFAMLADIVPRVHTEREWLVQERASDDAARAALLARLSVGGPPVVLAGVLGGVFAEGVDLPPGSLATACVVGPGLPPVGLERDLLRQYYDDQGEDGFRIASLIPGITRVVQAAGRVHRRPEDRGVIVLVGRRFRWRDVASLLPEWWEPNSALDPWDAVAAFFGTEGDADADRQDERSA